jgi:hypothetical protein
MEFVVVLFFVDVVAVSFLLSAVVIAVVIAVGVVIKGVVVAGLGVVVVLEVAMVVALGLVVVGILKPVLVLPASEQNAHARHPLHSQWLGSFSVHHDLQCKSEHS